MKLGTTINGTCGVGMKYDLLSPMDTDMGTDMIWVHLFWGKMISGNHFPPSLRVWQQRKIKFSGKSLPVDRNLRL